MDNIFAQLVLRDLIKDKFFIEEYLNRSERLKEALVTLAGTGNYRNGAVCPNCSSQSYSKIGYKWKIIKCDCCGKTYKIRQIPLFEVEEQ